MNNLKPNTMVQPVGNQQNMIGGSFGGVKPIQD